MKKRLLAVFAALCIAVGIMPQALAEAVLRTDNDGVYLIGTAEEMFMFAEEVNGGNTSADARLTADIDLGEKAWTPIGDGYDYKNYGIVTDTAYEGCFDGDGHTVSGLFIETKLYKKQGTEHFDTYCRGLFGILGQDATVKNLTVGGVINARAKGNEYIDAARYAGGICGINTGLILNCTNNVTVTAHTYVGGICGMNGAQLSGKLKADGEVIGCVNNAEITATSTSFAYGGGICGKLGGGTISYAQNHGRVTAPNTEGEKQCVALGGICGSDTNVGGDTRIERSCSDAEVGTGDGVYIGGIIGLCYGADITDVYATGNVYGAGYTGALVGYMTGGKIKNAYSAGAAAGDASKGEIDNVYALKDGETVTAKQLGSAFVDTDKLPAIDFSAAPSGKNESFEVSDFTLENGKLSITLDRRLYATKLSAADFEIEVCAGGKAASLENVRTAQKNGNVTVFEITFDPFCAEERLEISVNQITHDIVTPKSDFWTDYRARSFSGKGEKDAPYIISTPEELALLAYRVNRGENMSGKYFELGSDIDLSGKKWKSIGYADNYLENKYVGSAFEGVFDGRGKKIIGLSSVENGYVSGLFGLCGEESVLRDLTVGGRAENNSNSAYAASGGICAVNYGIIEGCESLAEVSSTGCAGGIAAYNGAVGIRISAIINACKNSGKVTANGDVGGIASFSSGTVMLCVNSGEVTSAEKTAGGIVGYNYEESVLLDACRNTGAVSAATYAGGIAAKSYKSIISNSYNAADVLSQRGKAGGIVGDTVSGYRVKNCYFLDGTADMPYAENSGTGFEAKSREELSQLAARLGENFVDGEDFPQLVWEMTGKYSPAEKKDNDTTAPTPDKDTATEEKPSFLPSGYPTAADGFADGDGSKENPYIISTGTELAYFANEVNGGRSFAGEYIALAGNIDISDKYHTPIGNTEETPFGGNFSGAGYAVTYCGDCETDISGFFGYTKNANIEMLGVYGLSEAKKLAGGLCASAQNTKIENCFADVYVDAPASGGLCGDVLAGSGVTNCYAAGMTAGEVRGRLFATFANGVSTENLYYRGIDGIDAVGANYSASTTVASGKTAEYMQSDAFCEDLWLVREKTDAEGEAVVVAPIFAVGERYPVLSGGYTGVRVISAKLAAPGNTLEVGAAHRFVLTVYAKNAAQLESAVWECDGAVISADENAKITRGTAEFTADIIFEKPSDSIEVKATVGGVSDSVRVAAKGALWQGNGTEKDPYIIADAEDFAALAASVAAGNSYSGVYFVQTADIDFGGEILPQVGFWGGIYSNEDGEWFESEKNRAFEGVFDGDGYSIKNAVLYAQDNYYGIFGYIGKSGTVKNITLAPTVRVAVHNDLRSVGGACGMNIGKIENCDIYADFNFTAYGVSSIAAVCGTNYGTISECENHSDMTASGDGKGGICGNNYGGIYQCISYGKISNASYGGGICIENNLAERTALPLVEKFGGIDFEGKISQCENLGDIDARYEAGGIACRNYGTTVDLCKNSGDVSGGCAGGIAAMLGAVTSERGIRHSKNYGTVTATGNYGGGICASNINGYIFFCENLGDVSAEKYAGGICGRCYSASSAGEAAVEFSNNFAVAESEKSGAVVGQYQDESGKCRVRYCYNDLEDIGLIAEVISRFGTDGVITENYHRGTAEDNYSEGVGDVGVPEKEATISVGASSISVSEETEFDSEFEVRSSDESVLSVKDKKAVGTGVGTAYLYTKSNPYSYAAVAVEVTENPEFAEKAEVKFTLIGEKKYGSDFDITSGVKNTYELWLPTASYTINVGDTVGKLIKTAFDENKIKSRGLEQGYISAVCAPDSTWLGEFSNGKYSGWMYTIDRAHPSLGINDQRLIGGEEIILHYVDDYRYEVADWYDSGEYAALSDGSMHNRWLAALDSDEEADTPSAGGGSLGKTDKAEADNAAEEERLPFDDVKEMDWYYDAVEYAFKNGLFAGISENIFAPDNAVTRAMFVSVLYRAAGSPTSDGKNVFGDVADDIWYANAVIWAAENNIVSGISEGIFAPDDEITREQLAAILARYAKYSGKDTSYTKELDVFTDCGDISEYALEPLGWAYAMGIISGKSETEICPRDTATRAETAAMLMRFILTMG